MATFNDQMEKLFDILRAVEDIRLAPEALEPDPVDISRPGATTNQGITNRLILLAKAKVGMLMFY